MLFVLIVAFGCPLKLDLTERTTELGSADYSQLDVLPRREFPEKSATRLRLCGPSEDLSTDFGRRARDLNPRPQGPESHALPSSHVDSCGFQFKSSDRAASIVQI